jgi:hypothetical protein
MKESVGTYDMFVFRQHKAVADLLQCSDNDDNGNSYFFFSEGEATIATIRGKYDRRARHVHTLSATNTCSHDVWNIDMEPVRTRFHGSMIFHRNLHSEWGLLSWNMDRFCF